MRESRWPPPFTRALKRDLRGSFFVCGWQGLGLIGLVRLIGLVGLIGLIGQIGLIRLEILISLIYGSLGIWCDEFSLVTLEHWLNGTQRLGESWELINTKLWQAQRHRRGVEQKRVFASFIRKGFWIAFVFQSCQQAARYGSVVLFVPSASPSSPFLCVPYYE